jgi:DNA helicase HerA-like ATPase
LTLIKITPDKVQIKSDEDQLTGLSINSAILIEDAARAISLVCIVSAITKNEEIDRFDEEGIYEGSESESTIECSIIGSLVNSLFTKAVDTYPTTDVSIRQINKATFEQMISSDVPASFRLGKYATYECPALIDGNKFFQRHSAILGNTGSGKSFTVASVMEKVAALEGSNVILFDVHGEYAGLDYVKRIKIGGETGLDFPIWFLPLKDIYGNLLRMKEESAVNQVAALRKAFYEARASDKSEEIPIAFSLDDMVASLVVANSDEVETGEYYKTGDKAGLPKTIKGENNGKLTSVINLLNDKLLDKRYEFMTRPVGQEYLGMFVHDLFSIGNRHIKVIDFSDVPSDMIPVIVAVTARLMYRIQLQQDRQNMVPLCMICDEAHVYIPSSDFGLGASQRRLLDIFETIAKEGRKFGTSLMIVSQRPSELNRTILSQCANYIVLKMSNDADKQMIKGLLPDGSKDVIDSVNLFSPGDCLVIGDCCSITYKIKIDLPSQQPNISTRAAWSISCSTNKEDYLNGTRFNPKRRCYKSTGSS